MKLFALVNSGLETISAEEIKELTKITPLTYQNVLEFSLEDKEEILKLIYGSQSIRKIIVSLGKFRTVDSINFNDVDLNLKDFFSDDLSFKVEVENVKGQENRISIAKMVVGKVFSKLKELNISPKVELKKPDLVVDVFFNGENYFVGIDLCGVELDARPYRVFPHAASFKGDMGYFFVRKSKFKLGNNLLVGFVKDGVIAIEAALNTSGFFVQNTKKKEFSLFKFPFFNKFDFQSFFTKTLEDKSFQKNIVAFDESQQNITSARKNAQLVGVKELIDFHKISLDELDVKFKENMFDNLIFQITTKDEDKLNEIYYQASYVLKQKGILLLIGRKNWKPSISDKFKLLSEEEVHKGESVHKIWLLEKK
ncbi:MAG: THUMP domain-containing protein [Nanoarchaeota archaeon]|nr:methyltransferase domain-containing protein [Nanoarchaeota archaeon]